MVQLIKSFLLSVLVVLNKLFSPASYLVMSSTLCPLYSAWAASIIVGVGLYFPNSQSSIELLSNSFSVINLVISSLSVEELHNIGSYIFF
jgi:hypothetical protein